jgi:hypothetical protein
VPDGGFYSSSTGKPKGVEVNSIALQHAEEVDIIEIPTGVLLAPVPFVGRMNISDLPVKVVPFIDVDVFIEEFGYSEE